MMESQLGSTPCYQNTECSTQYFHKLRGDLLEIFYYGKLYPNFPKNIVSFHSLLSKSSCKYQSY